MPGESEEKFLKTERKPCTFPGCSRLLSRYNDTDQCRSHTIYEVVIERKPNFKPKRELTCVSIPEQVPKPKVWRPLPDDIPVYRRILIATLFHFNGVTEADIRGTLRLAHLVRARTIIIYLVHVHTHISNKSAVKLVNRNDTTMVKFMVDKVQNNPEEYAADLAKIRGYCNLEKPQKQAAE